MQNRSETIEEIVVQVMRKNETEAGGSGMRDLELYVDSSEYRAVAKQITQEILKRIMDLPTHREIGWIGIEQADILKLFGVESDK